MQKKNFKTQSDDKIQRKNLSPTRFDEQYTSFIFETPYAFWGIISPFNNFFNWNIFDI